MRVGGSGDRNLWRDAAFGEPEPTPDGPPPHATLCAEHRRYYRIECPWCRAERRGYSLEGAKPTARAGSTPTPIQKTIIQQLRAKRTSYDRMGRRLGIAPSTVWKWVKEGLV